MAKTFIDAAEVAERLALSRPGFLLKRQDLVENEGFPEHMPHCARPLLWRASEVEAWIARQGLPRTAPVTRVGGNVVRLERMAASA
ncbi:helix-turn-helix transcriptional regulator [Oceaniglobus trochenteri]|uniref:helix-turn-helix transcriptional regulator n=1 Tax=Oceaniglobus trochenteri TaxID=2763260 RepID=UPI001CFF6939|nr:hypothetical protein [Oceaniglobus trochenteri]